MSPNLEPTRRHKLHIVQNNFFIIELKLFITHCVVPPFPKKLTLFGSPEVRVLKIHNDKKTDTINRCLFFYGCGSKTRTYDLRVMSPTSYQLLHPAILNMPEFLSVLYIIAENMHMSIPYLYYSQKMLIIHNFTG